MKTRLLLGLILWAFAFTSSFAQAQPANLAAAQIKEIKAKADKGDASAQLDLGHNYFVQKNYAEAVKWYRKAADQGRCLAQNKLGVMCQVGRGVEKDYTEAVKWYRKAAAQGYDAAQSNLGVMYHDGHGVKQDYAEALKWYRKAADQDNALAQFYLGEMYELGQGVEKDYVKAYAYYNLAANNVTVIGDKVAEINRINLEKKMAPQQLTEAQKRTKELRALIKKPGEAAPTKP